MKDLWLMVQVLLFEDKGSSFLVQGLELGILLGRNLTQILQCSKRSLDGIGFALIASDLVLDGS